MNTHTADFIAMIAKTRAANTAKTYAQVLADFIAWTKTDAITEDNIIAYIDSLDGYSPATIAIRTATLARFARFCKATYRDECHIDTDRLTELLSQRTSRTGSRLPPFDKRAIESVIAYADMLNMTTQNPRQNLINARDRALIITLAETGLRVHEACNLRRGDLDHDTGTARIIGKGNKEAIVHFSPRSLAALKSYLALRAEMDGKTGKPLATLPIFARHDRGTGSKTQPITTMTATSIVDTVVLAALGTHAPITPHTFRHYFVTKALHKTGNIELSRQLARHSNIRTTTRYVHLTDKDLADGYNKIFGGD
jgi:site-specific recombinase XerD